MIVNKKGCVRLVFTKEKKICVSFNLFSIISILLSLTANSVCFVDIQFHSFEAMDFYTFICIFLQFGKCFFFNPAHILINFMLRYCLNQSIQILKCTSTNRTGMHIAVYITENACVNVFISLHMNEHLQNVQQMENLFIHIIYGTASIRSSSVVSQSSKQHIRTERTKTKQKTYSIISFSLVFFLFMKNKRIVNNFL